LGILYHFDNAWHVATRGSFTSEQAQAAQAMLKSYSLADIPTEGVTPLVEIIYPENRIVVDYGATRDIFLLAALSTATGNRLNSFWWEGPRVNYLTLTLAEAIESKTTTGTETEGYVITFPDGEMAKIKLDEYVRLHRILTGTNAVRIWEALQDPDLWAILVEKVPDEFYQWVTITATDLSKSYRQIKHTAHREFEANRYLADTSRKDFALWAKDRPYNDILFRMLDGKDYDHNIWKRIKPEPTRPFREEI
jgi:RNA ligase